METEAEATESPLAGITVVDLSQMLAGPAAALWLADYGATVVKVEPPHGDGGRMLRSAAAAHLDPPPMFSVYNRNKAGTRLDLTVENDRQTAWRLIAGADVVVESARPGVMERLGFGADAVMSRFPSLVYASVSGFGWGPLGRERPGVDLIVQAESGMMSVTGQREGPPTKVGFTVVDAACGHALCHGILAALLRRERTGVGGRVRISLYDVALNLQVAPIAEYLRSGVQPPRFGNSAAHTSPADLFACSDGEIILAAYLDAHWSRLMDVLEDENLRADPRFATPQSRVVHREALFERLAAHLRARTVGQWVDRLSAAGILVARVRDYHQVTSDPMTDESGVLSGGRAFPVLRSPVLLDGHDPPAAVPLRALDGTCAEPQSATASEVGS